MRAREGDDDQHDGGDRRQQAGRQRGDAGLLERAFANIVETAVKCSPEDVPVPVPVSASAIADRVEVHVVGRGPGVPDSAKDRIFEPFQRYGDAPRGAGVGLGLAVPVASRRLWAARSTPLSQVEMAHIADARTPGLALCKDDRRAVRPPTNCRPMKQLPALWFVLHVMCAVCKAQTARLELTPPELNPASWSGWNPATRDLHADQRDTEQWWLIIESEAYANGCGENVTAQDAARLQAAFRYPRSFARVRSAGLKGDAGFCPCCDVSYCARHWSCATTPHDQCPRGHQR